MTHDQVLDMLKYLGMGNRPEDKVKVIFVPCYLDGRDGIMNKEYYDILLGQDLSVYASYYEPWGYTPLESVSFHVPTITTDLAGFGLWVNSLKNQHGINDGVEVLHRSDYNYSEVADGIKDTITLFADKTDKEVKEIRKRAAEVAEQALWKHFMYRKLCRRLLLFLRPMLRLSVVPLPAIISRCMTICLLIMATRWRRN